MALILMPGQIVPLGDGAKSNVMLLIRCVHLCRRTSRRSHSRTARHIVRTASAFEPSGVGNVQNGLRGSHVAGAAAHVHLLPSLSVGRHRAAPVGDFVDEELVEDKVRRRTGRDGRRADDAQIGLGPHPLNLFVEDRPALLPAEAHVGTVEGDVLLAGRDGPREDEFVLVGGRPVARRRVEDPAYPALRRSILPANELYRVFQLRHVVGWRCVGHGSGSFWKVLFFMKMRSCS